MHIVKEYKDSKTTPDENYNTATNVLGTALTTMKDNIAAFLKQDHTLDAEYWPLLDVLENYAAQNNNPEALPEKLNARNFDSIYQRWLKVNKVFSHERMSILETYAQALRDKDTPGVEGAAASATADSKTKLRQITHLNGDHEFDSSNLLEGSTDEELSSKASNSPPPNKTFK